MDSFHDETVTYFRDAEMLADDVMLVTFPKCGTTWMWKILHSLLRMDKSGALPTEGKFNREEDFQQYWDFLPIDPPPPTKSEDGTEQPPGFCARDLLEQPSPRLFSTHLPPRMLPDALKATGKLVYVLRNPKDAQVSMHYMGGPPDDGWEGTFERLMDPSSPQVYGTLAAHMIETEQYIKDHLGDRALVVTYEELSADLPGMLVRLAEFLDVPLPEAKLEAVKQRVAFRCGDDIIHDNEKEEEEEEEKIRGGLAIAECGHARCTCVDLNRLCVYVCACVCLPACLPAVYLPVACVYEQYDVGSGGHCGQGLDAKGRAG
jgi:hypothetical protein